MDRQWRRECDAECRGSAGTLLCGGFGGDNVRRGATDPLRTAEAAKAGDAVVAPKQEGEQGFYRLAARWSAPTGSRDERCADQGGAWFDLFRTFELHMIGCMPCEAAVSGRALDAFRSSKRFVSASTVSVAPCMSSASTCVSSASVSMTAIMSTRFLTMSSGTRQANAPCSGRPWSTGWLRSYLTEVIWSFSLSWVVDVAFPFSPSIHLSVAKVTSVFQTYILYQNPLSRGRVRFSQYAQNRLCADSRNKLDFVNGVPTAKIGCC